MLKDKLTLFSTYIEAHKEGNLLLKKALFPRIIGDDPSNMHYFFENSHFDIIGEFCEWDEIVLALTKAHFMLNNITKKYPETEEFIKLKNKVKDL